MYDESKPVTDRVLRFQEAAQELCDKYTPGKQSYQRPMAITVYLWLKYDLTKHPKYPLTSDSDKRNRFDIEKFLNHNLILKPDDEYIVIEVNEGR